MTSEYAWLTGKVHAFPDGVQLRILQVKIRETGPWVTYEHVYQGAMPKRFTQKLGEFTDTYGHLFPKD